MKNNNILNNGIPISVSLNSALEAENFEPQKANNKKRLLTISALTFLVAIAISFIAKVLVALIDLFTNISFYGKFSIEHSSPANNTLGIFVILIPAAGGIIVGLMALYGSKAIRGHGIPEAMEQILTNKSRIRPSITYLKPVSAAISIGTGGPFGAEGPIIATGGALGSTIGQLLRISHHERKILLAAGATAGMSAIFGSPIAAIFLAIELLLFEFSPRSIIPVSIACITGAAGHHLLFGQDPVFAMPFIEVSNNYGLASYSVIGVIIGLLSALVTKAVYFIEDAFEKLPIHWMWWPAIGGIAVGIVGYFAPRTLGVGYDNITDILSGTVPLKVILFLCILKFVSWAIALGSGTSGGTLAPLLTIGGATGALLGLGILHFFPGCGLTIPLAALVGMSAMFAGASRALLTSIIFAVETTAQSNALLPLLSACIASYFVSFFLMQNTIMTEKIARRGVKTPDSYEPDILEAITVEQMMNENETFLSEENTIREVVEWLNTNAYTANYFLVVNNEGLLKGFISTASLFSNNHSPENKIGSLNVLKPVTISTLNSLRFAVGVMAREGVDVLPVTADEDKNQLAGVLSYKDIISAYRKNSEEHEKNAPHISIKRKRLKIMVRGQQLMEFVRIKKS
ncbi:MAG: chloride channel protein [Bacteroidetes bacterium]|nr:chloride channel protein [Bacteroidota bacterium]